MLHFSLCLVFRVYALIVGVFNGEGPPVPIPNTEVKLTSADDTCLETDWKNRSMPTRSRPNRAALILYIVPLRLYIKSSHAERFE